MKLYFLVSWQLLKKKKKKKAGLSDQKPEIRNYTAVMVSGLEKVFFTSTLVLISLNVIVSVKHSYTKCIILLVIGTWGYVVQTFQIPDLWLSIEKVTFLCYYVIWRKQCCETCVLSNGWTFLKYWEKKILFLFISVAENTELSQHLTSLNLISILMLSGISYPNLDTLVSQATCGEGWHRCECGIPMHTYLAKWLILIFLPLVFRILSL